MNTTINPKTYDPTPARRVAFLGLGVMGFPMAGHLALAGHAVTLSDGTQGTAHGVTEDGTLLVHTARGMQAITSAEISVRPSAAARPA